ILHLIKKLVVNGMSSMTLKKEKMSGPELSSATSDEFDLPEYQAETYRLALSALNSEHVPFVVEGAFAIYFYCGIWRATKDLDIFAEEAVVPHALDVLERAGFETKIVEPIWLSKAFYNGCCVDIIHGSGNRVAKIDRLWVERAHPATILGQHVLVASPEDTI